MLLYNFSSFSSLVVKCYCELQCVVGYKDNKLLCFGFVCISLSVIFFISVVFSLSVEFPFPLSIFSSFLLCYLSVSMFVCFSVSLPMFVCFCVSVLSVCVCLLPQGGAVGDFS